MTRTFYTGGAVTVVGCDFVGHEDGAVCAEEFRTASLRSVVGKQLVAARWLARKDAAGDVIDLCPYHARSVTQPMTFAKEQEQRRTAALSGEGTRS